MGKTKCKRDEKISSLCVLILNCFTVGAPKKIFLPWEAF